MKLRGEYREEPVLSKHHKHHKMKTLYTVFPYAIAIICAVVSLPTYPVVSAITFGMLALAAVLHACAWYIGRHRSKD